MTERKIPRDRMDLGLLEFMARKGIERGDGAIKGVACEEIIDLVAASRLLIELSERYGDDLNGDSGLDALVERARAIVSDWKDTPSHGRKEPTDD